MQEVFNFVVSNWKLIASLLLLLSSLVIALVRKRPASSIIGEIFDLVITFVDAVEVPGNGEVKKAKVIDMVLETLKNRYPKLDVKQYVRLIEIEIERVLDTPQKKG